MYETFKVGQIVYLKLTTAEREATCEYRNNYTSNYKEYKPYKTTQICDFLSEY